LFVFRPSARLKKNTKKSSPFSTPTFTLHSPQRACRQLRFDLSSETSRYISMHTYLFAYRVNPFVLLLSMCVYMHLSIDLYLFIYQLLRSTRCSGRASSCPATDLWKRPGMYLFLSICIYLYPHVCRYAYTYIYIHISIKINTYIYMYK